MLSILNRCSLFAQTVYGAQGHAINTEKRASNGKDYVRCGMRHRKSFALFGVRYVVELLFGTPGGYGCDVCVRYLFLVLGMLNAFIKSLLACVISVRYT